MSGMKIIIGTGYLQHPSGMAEGHDVEAVTEFIVNDVGGGNGRDHGRIIEEMAPARLYVRS